MFSSYWYKRDIMIINNYPILFIHLGKKNILKCAKALDSFGVHREHQRDSRIIYNLCTRIFSKYFLLSHTFKMAFWNQLLLFLTRFQKLTRFMKSFAYNKAIVGTKQQVSRLMRYKLSICSPTPPQALFPDTQLYC